MPLGEWVMELLFVPLLIAAVAGAYAVWLAVACGIAIIHERLRGPLSPLGWLVVGFAGIVVLALLVDAMVRP